MSAMRAILAIVVLCSAFAGDRALADPSPEDIAHGKALVEAGNCGGCHTADPAKPFAGGKRIVNRFGSIYAPNLTPDRDTGIGGWSDADFYNALRYGVAPDGSRYTPAFPYPYLTKLTRDDILSIRAYLTTLAPFSSTAPKSELRFPFNFRPLMRVWNDLFFKPGIYEPDQNKGAAWNRGGYLVTGLSHCGACHTPKNVFGADRPGEAFAGGSVQGRPVPRLDAQGDLKSWSADDIVAYLQNSPNAKSHPGGLMADIVANSTSQISDGDVRAIATYLKDLPQHP
jgi:mono/diheme cytochrome c family protein